MEQEKQKKNFIKSDVLSSLSLRLLELMERGHNTFAEGWKPTIKELVKAGKIEIKMEYNNGNTRVSKIA